MARLKLNVELVERQRRRMGIRPVELARLMGMSRQAYYEMIKNGSAIRAERLAEIFDLERDALVKIV